MSKAKTKHKIDYKSILTPPSSINSLEFGIFIVCIGTGIISVFVMMIGVEFTLANIIKIIVSLIVIFLLSDIISYYLVKPIKKLGSQVEDYSNVDNKDLRVNIKSYLEFDEITNSINDILTDVNAMNESRSEFVSNVSHELKTPITSIKVLADSLIAQEGAVPIELYEEFMRDIAKEVERESDIITDLLTLVKLDQTAAELEIKNKSINDLIELLMKRLVPIANEQNIELVSETFKEVRADIDETKLTLALSNLIENAIKYNVEGGWVHISLNSDEKYFYIKIKDSGIGIPEENIDHIFERFYRADKSHSQQISGTGLGLAITRSTIVMHRGSIKVTNNTSRGTLFAVRIPLNYTV